MMRFFQEYGRCPPRRIAVRAVLVLAVSLPSSALTDAVVDAEDVASPMLQEAENPTEGPRERLGESDRNRIVLATTGVGIVGVTAWGVVNWDYFTRSPHAESEGWFGENTKSGGMDKLGHLYTTYAVSRGIAGLYEHWNVERGEAALYGSLTSFAILGYMELGDSFSDYGFSHEDMICNTIGSLLGYLLHVRPELASKIDLRWQIGLAPNKADILTDYDNSTFLLALKLNGFESMQRSWLRHIELHAGYHTEGFENAAEKNTRHPYLGVGFNLTDLFRRHGHAKTATFLHYIQLPRTSVNHDFDW